MSRLSLFRGSWGALLVICPRLVLDRLGGDRSAGVARAARVLGARHLAEAVWLGRCRGVTPPRWLAGIDVVHVLSMLTFARWSPRVRRDALASAAVSVGLAVTSEVQRSHQP